MRTNTTFPLPVQLRHLTERAAAARVGINTRVLDGAQGSRERALKARAVADVYTSGFAHAGRLGMSRRTHSLIALDEFRLEHYASTLHNVFTPLEDEHTFLELEGFLEYPLEMLELCGDDVYSDILSAFDPWLHLSQLLGGDCSRTEAKQLQFRLIDGALATTARERQLEQDLRAVCPDLAAFCDELGPERLLLHRTVAEKRHQWFLSVDAYLEDRAQLVLVGSRLVYDVLVSDVDILTRGVRRELPALDINISASFAL